MSGFSSVGRAPLYPSGVERLVDRSPPKLLEESSYFSGVEERPKVNISTGTTPLITFISHPYSLVPIVKLVSRLPRDLMEQLQESAMDKDFTS